MEAFSSTTNPFGGVIPDPDSFPMDPDVFGTRLSMSLDLWRDDGYLVVWLELRLDRAELVPAAAGLGFVYHHAVDDYVMMTFRLQDGAFIPAYASHYIGAGGVAVNSRDEILVVIEKRGRSGRPGSFKLPGGALIAGEHLQEAVVREVLEETGVRTRFDSLVCLRHQHQYRYGKSDIYFVCLLTPLSEQITLQVEEIEECTWMPVKEYFADENVSPFNKDIVRAALGSPGLVATEVRGYPDPETREFFMPRDLASS